MVSQRNQMRRHAQKMRRHGIQPVTMIGPRDQFPDIAAVVFGRWLWRYRSELAPLAVALTLALVSWMTHARYSGWWPAIAGTGVPAASVLGAAGPRIGLVTFAERGYGAVVAAAAAGWLALQAEAILRSRTSAPRRMTIKEIKIIKGDQAHRGTAGRPGCGHPRCGTCRRRGDLQRPQPHADLSADIRHNSRGSAGQPR